MRLLLRIDVDDLARAEAFYCAGCCLLQFLGRGYDEIARP